MRSRVSTILVAAIIALTTQNFARADESPEYQKEAAEKAHALEAQGEHLYNATKFSAAAARFAAAAQWQESVVDYYAIGQSALMAGDCATSLQGFRTFLSRPHNFNAEKMIEHANESIARCDAVIGDMLPTAIALQPLWIDGRPYQQYRVVAPAPWGKDIAGGLLIGFGIGMAATGAGLWGHYAAQSHGADGYRDAGIALVSAGGVAIIGGIVRYIVAAHASRKPAYIEPVATSPEQ